MRSLLFAGAVSLAALLFAGEAAAQIERLDPPPGRQPRQRPQAGGGPLREALFVAPSGEPFRAPGDAPYPVSVWFARADADHDGRLTLKEFTDDSLSFFDRLDANHDGVVDGFEAQAYEHTLVPELNAQGADFGLRAPAKRGLFGGKRPQQGTAEGAALYGLLNEPQPVAGADSDLDRKITKAEEIAASQRRFARLDKDGDGYLILATLPVTQAQLQAQAFAAERAKRGQRPGGPPAQD